MKEILIFALLALPAAVCAQEEGRALLGVEEPAADKASAAAPADQAAGGDEPAQRPDAARLMSEISAPLRLSSKQEERISAAVAKKAAEFDKRMKDYEKASSEERAWRFKMNEARYAMQKLDRDLPDTVRDFLDDEQREAYEALLAAKEKAARPEPAVSAAPSAEEGAPKPGKKRRLVRRKKAPAAVRGETPAAGTAAAREEEGGVMVDKEGAAAPKKRRLVRRKKVRAAAAPAAAPESPAAPGKPAEAPAGDQAAQDAEGGYYP